MPEMRVVHFKRDDYDVYIGRGSGEKNDPLKCEPGDRGYFGNPIKYDGSPCLECGEAHSRPGETLKCYRKWLKTRITTDPVFVEELKKLAGKTLGCWCAPRRCHGEIIREILEDL